MSSGGLVASFGLLNFSVQLQPQTSGVGWTGVDFSLILHRPNILAACVALLAPPKLASEAFLTSATSTTGSTI